MQEWPGLGSMRWEAGRGQGQRENEEEHQVSEAGLGQEEGRVSALDTLRRGAHEAAKWTCLRGNWIPSSWRHWTIDTDLRVIRIQAKTETCPGGRKESGGQHSAEDWQLHRGQQ